jgi:hypothetical protein
MNVARSRTLPPPSPKGGSLLVTRLEPGNADPEALPPFSSRGRASLIWVSRQILGTSQHCSLPTLRGANNPKADRPNRPESKQPQLPANFPNSDKQNNAVPTAAQTYL